MSCGVRFLLAFALVIALPACSTGNPTPPRDGSAGDATAPDTGPPPPWGARYHGVVYGPGGLFPVSGALVAAYVEPPPAIPSSTYCERCVELPSGIAHTTSAADGSFTIQIPVGANVHLVTQKGQFRQVWPMVAEATPGDYPVPGSVTTLPSRNGSGGTIPRIALVYGDSDAIQDVLAKAGIGETDGAYGHRWGSEVGVFDVFDNSGFAEPHGEPLASLIQDLDRMLQYHVIFFACSYNANFSFMQDATVQSNLREYVRRGGKLYVSDYAYAVVDMVWPEFVWFDDPLHGGCVENRFPDGCNHGPPFDAPSRTRDTRLAEWLLAVDPTSSAIAGGASFTTRENWNTIGGVFPGYIGDDPTTGARVMGEPRVWVEGTWNYEPDDAPASWDRATHHPFTVSWPFGCGRVLYTTYHTVGGTDRGRHPGFLTQELILWDLIMELQVCADIDLI